MCLIYSDCCTHYHEGAGALSVWGALGSGTLWPKGTWDLSELSCLSYVWGPTGLNNANIGLQTSQKSDICTYTASV